MSKEKVIKAIRDKEMIIVPLDTLVMGSGGGGGYSHTGQFDKWSKDCACWSCQEIARNEGWK